ncbi:RE1 [Symbiodinium sp. CCMP2456]|nr:RE1 [Symbiodinium sp. CCMP2456]
MSEQCSVQSSPGKKRKPPAPPNRSIGLDLLQKDPKSTVKIFLSRYLARDPVWAEDCWYSSWSEDSQFIAELHVPRFNDKIYVGTWSLTQKTAGQSAAKQFIDDSDAQEIAQRLPLTMRSIKYWKKHAHTMNGNTDENPNAQVMSAQTATTGTSAINGTYGSMGTAGQMNLDDEVRLPRSSVEEIEGQELQAARRMLFRLVRMVLGFIQLDLGIKARRLQEMSSEAPLLFPDKGPGVEANAGAVEVPSPPPLPHSASSDSGQAEVIQAEVRRQMQVASVSEVNPEGLGLQSGRGQVGDAMSPQQAGGQPQAQEWYTTQFVPAGPLARVRLKAPVSEVDREQRWNRVRHRMEHLILQSCPETVRSELSAARVSGVVSIMCRLFTIYKPGGVTERAEALRQVQHPRAADSPIDAVLKLRTWKRWMTRLADLGGTPPDAAVSIQALEGITSGVLKALPSLAFRVNLVRASLHLDTQPSTTKVNEFFEHLLAELEGVSRVTDAPAGGTNAAKAEGNKGVRQVEARGSGQGGDSPKKLCKWFHEGQGHRKDACTTVSGQGVLREALSGGTVSGATPMAAAAKIQAQLDDLEARVLDGTPRACAVERFNKVPGADDREESTESTALLDSGATHAVLDLSSVQHQKLEPCTVSLAGDQRQTWHQTPGGSLVAPNTAEGHAPQTILPLGCLVVRWSRKAGLQVIHPRLGKMKTSLKSGCPQVSKDQAVMLIKELESAKLSELTGRLKKVRAYIEAKKGLKFQEVPAHLLSQLAFDFQECTGWDFLKDRGHELVVVNTSQRDRLTTEVETGKFVHLRSVTDPWGLPSNSAGVQSKVEGDTLSALQPMWLWLMRGARYGWVRNNARVYAGPFRLASVISKGGGDAAIRAARSPASGGVHSQAQGKGSGSVEVANGSESCPPQVEKKEVGAPMEPIPKKAKLSDKEHEKWKRHVASHHIPFRKDCLQCVMAGALGVQHRRVKCPQMFALAFDMMGPFKEQGRDDRGSGYKYALVAGLRVPECALPPQDEKPGRGSKADPLVEPVMTAPPPDNKDNALKDDDASSEASWLRADLEPTAGVSKVDGESSESEEEQGSEPGWFEVPGVDEPPDEADEDAEVDAGGIGCEDDDSVPLPPLEAEVWEDDPDMSALTDEAFDDELSKMVFAGSNKVLRFVVPLKSRKGPQILAGLQEVVTECNRLGFPVKVAHTDRAKELMSKATMDWMQSKLIQPSFTQGDDPKSNGLAERLVGWVKARARIGCCKVKVHYQGHVLMRALSGGYLVAKNVRCMEDLVDPEESPDPDPTPVPSRRVTGKRAVRLLEVAFEGEAKATKRQHRGQWDFSVILGAYSHGGLRGVTRSSMAHPNVCRYLNEYLRRNRGMNDVVPTWTALMVAVADEVSVHRDVRNEPGSFNFVTQVTTRALWLEEQAQEEPQGQASKVWSDSQGREFQGRLVPIGHEVTAFNPKQRHALLPATNWVIAAYSPLGSTKLHDEKKGILRSLGFRLGSEIAPSVCKLVGPNPQRLPAVRARPPPPPPGRTGLHVRYARMNAQEWAELCELDEEAFEQGFARWQRVLGGHDEDLALDPLSASIPHHLLMATVFQQRNWSRNPELHLPTADGLRLLAYVFEFSDDGYVDDSPFPDRMLMFSIRDMIRDVLEMVVLRVELIHEPEPQEEMHQPVLQVPGPALPEVRAVQGYQHAKVQDRLDREVPRLPFPLPNPTFIKDVPTGKQVGPLEEALVCKTEATTTRDLESVLSSLTEPLSVTHTASQEEVRMNLERWRPAIEKELSSLKGQGVLVSHFGTDAQSRIANPGTSVISLKGVFTAKAPGGPEDGLYKRKCRLVGCGNQATHVDADSLYAAGAPAEVVRTALVQATRHRWSAFTTDIKSAFTQTPIPKNAAQRYLLRPPRWLVDLGLARADEYYSLGMVLYGFKEAPAWWSDHRDSKLFTAKFLGCHLEQGKSDSSIWKIMKGETLQGYLVTYVDDFLILSDKATAHALHQWLIDGAGWDTDGLSEATSESPVRFLGMQLRSYPDGHFSLDQEAYVEELVRAYNLGEGDKSKIVCPRELLMCETETVEPFDEATTRAAQKVAGECLWLAQRSRIDICFATTALCSRVSKDPHGALAVGRRILAYLHHTKDYRLHLRPDEKVAPVRVFTDASFSPQGRHSFGGHVIEVFGAPVLWKASRQALIALSSSECELIQAVEGCMYTESLMTVLSDLGVDCNAAELMLDNTASISFISGSGNQRTRHLKVRASKVKQLIQAGWAVKHCPGEWQKADLLTKVLPSSRMRFLCDLLHLGNGRQQPEEEEILPNVRAVAPSSSACLTGLLTMLQTCISAGASLDEESVDQGVAIEWPWELAALTLLVVLSTLFVWEASGAPCSRRSREVPKIRAVTTQKHERKSKKLQERVAAAIDSALSESPTGDEGLQRRRKGRNKCLQEYDVDHEPRVERAPTVVYGDINVGVKHAGAPGEDQKFAMSRSRKELAACQRDNLPGPDTAPRTKGAGWRHVVAFDFENDRLGFAMEKASAEELVAREQELREEAGQQGSIQALEQGGEPSLDGQSLQQFNQDGADATNDRDWARAEAAAQAAMDQRSAAPPNQVMYHEDLSGGSNNGMKTVLVATALVMGVGAFCGLFSSSRGGLLEETRSPAFLQHDPAAGDAGEPRLEAAE